MPVKLSQAAFCSLVLESGLISRDRLTRLREQFLQQHQGRDAENCLALTEYLVRQNEMTLWQAKKLLQGKHKGFFVGKYKLLSLLGRGGMSSVYLAEHTVMRRWCAIKILPFKQVKNAAALSRFHREAQAVASLDDPNIVRAYDVDKLTEAGNEIHFLVMEYVDGRSLQQVVLDDGPLSISEAVDYIRQAASGLAHAHSVGVVHRDVKPSNLLLDESGTIKLLDLGLARIFEDASEQSSLTIEHQQTVLGTADYLSPEQAVDSHGVDHRSDIYSLGCSLYFLLTGHPPFTEGSLTQRLLSHQTKTPAPVTASRPEVPATLVAVLERMMAKRPDARYQTAAKLVDALTTWLDDHAELVPAVPRRVENRSARARQRPPNPKRAGGTTSTSSPHKAGRTSSTTSPEKKPRDDKRQPATLPIDSVRDGDSDDDLLSFLRDLDSTIGHETVDPSFPTSDTIVSDADVRPGKPRGEVTPESSSPNVLDSHPRNSKPEKAASGDQRHHNEEIVPAMARRSPPKRSHSPSVLAAVVGGAIVAAVLIGGYYLWGVGDEPASPLAVGDGSAPANSVDAAAEVRPDIDPEGEIQVGPDGHFATIGAALDHVRETFHPLSPDDAVTIRVAGGLTYNERIAIDNSQSRTFPQGVRLICEDDEPAVLEPTGSDPILDLRTVERFQFKGFTLRGSGQPELVRLEGYLVRTVLEKLVIEGAGETAVRGLGATGLVGANRLMLKDLTLRDPHAGAIAMRFSSSPTPTKNVAIRGCRVLSGFETGINFRGGVSGVEISQCIFDRAETAVQFENTSDVWEDIIISNCTFRDFECGIRLARPLSPSDGTFQFTRNLFVEASGPECLIDEQSSTIAGLPPQFSASFNWTQRPAPAASQPEEIDLFEQNGRRGAGVTFVSVDPTQPSIYLQPESQELKEASAKIPRPPKQIGAVPSAAP